MTENQTPKAPARRRTAAKPAAPDAAAAKDAAVLNGVGSDKPATPEALDKKAAAPKPTPARGTRPGSKANAVARQAAKAAPAKAAAKPAPEPEANGKVEPGYRRYATSEIPSAMVGFTKWIAREFPELGPVDPRLVTVASKAYRYFQASDLNK